MTAREFVFALFDPRGRIDRKGLLIVSSLLIGLEIVSAIVVYGFDVAPNAPFIIALKALFAWLGLAATARRLHDLGLSAWRIAGAAAAQCVWTAILVIAMLAAFGVERMAPGTPGFVMLSAGCLVPAFVVALWLHLATGDAGVNRYGARPGELGFGAPHAAAPATLFSRS